MLDKDTVISMSRLYAERVKVELDPLAVYLFGSYAKGNAREYSDIDIAVIVGDFDGDWWEASNRLNSLCRGISYYIEPHLIERDDEDEFYNDIINTGIRIA